jgi:hypothetical protein
MYFQDFRTLRVYSFPKRLSLDNYRLNQRQQLCHVKNVLSNSQKKLKEEIYLTRVRIRVARLY